MNVKGKELTRIERKDLATRYAEACTNPSTRTMLHNARIRRSVVQKFLEWVGKAPQDVTSQDVADFRSDMEARGLSKATQYQRISFLSRFFEWLMAQGMVQFNPVPAGTWRNGFRPKAYDSEKVQALELSEVKALLAAIDRETVAGARLYAMIMVILDTGMRSAEVCDLRWSNCKLGNGKPTVRTKTKGGGWATFEVTSASTEAITAYLQLSGRKPRGKQALFSSIPRQRGARRDGPLHPHYLWSQVKRIASKAGIEDMTVHRLRHTFATLANQGGVTTPELQSQLGHRALKTTEIYLSKLAPRSAKGGRVIQAMLNSENEDDEKGEQA